MFVDRLIGGEKSLLIAHLLDALDHEGCAVCRLAAEAQRRYLAMLLHERVNDGGSRQKLAASHGFCPRHTELLLTVGGRGSHAKIAILYHDQIAALIDEVAQLPDAQRGSASVTQGMQGACRVCEKQARTEELYTEMLADRLRKDDMQGRYAASDGLCLTHFRQTYDVARPAARPFLRADQTQRLRRLAHHLGEFIRKSAQWANAGREAFGDERDAWIRALRVYDGDLEAAVVDAMEQEV